ncbi:site-specific integrase [Frigoriflavimonas asaccharolytica]|uniref:Integrase n=2 Tax=Frigoriflavimonas asaccharolytica TaxID=2735899 RepID=A0A8J8G989_9FLAO|nr:site-specific integrase [Frigoriflavimonas asaccharolytica]NRS93808.1 integrase [Frigoriflavimonas asaccharolytica]
MEFTYHSQFLLDKEKDSPTGKIRFRIKWDKNIVAFGVGYRAEFAKWSIETQRCKTNSTHGIKKISASVINKKISDYEAACERVFNSFYYEKKIPDQKSVRDRFNLEIGKKVEKEIEPEKTLFEIFDLFVLEESRINLWTNTTSAKMKTFRKHLKTFNSKLNFENIDEKKLLQYQYFLQDKLQLQNSTTLKNFSFLRWFLKWATRKGFNSNMTFQNFRPKLKTVQKKIIFLTQAELKHVKEFKIPAKKQYLDRVRDVFLFQCFTGLRYSDVENLKRSDINENFIEIITVKTSDSLVIELNDHSKALLNKYKDSQFDDYKALPVISNQRMNEYLRELMELAKIDEPVRETYYKGNQRYDEVFPKYALMSSHAGRRTFICNALSLGIPPQVVMKWTGHSDYSAMKPYIDIADQTKINAMEKFNLL